MSSSKEDKQISRQADNKTSIEWTSGQVDKWISTKQISRYKQISR